jgi:hypothetical protein
MSEIKVNKISPKQTCTQLTLGDSGDTIIIPAGATITNNGTATGFGRTGSVNWDTTKKTTGFTAVNGSGYFCDTTSAAFTATLPATPTAGDIVAFSDYAGTFATNNLTIGRNSSNINGSASNFKININNSTATFIYVDATEGWRLIDTGSFSSVNDSLFVTATGGTISTCGDYKIHTFTGPGTFCVSSAGNANGSNSVDYMVVAGGGGSGTGDNVCSSGGGAGGGAGGWRASSGTASGSYNAGPAPLVGPVSALPVSVQGYPITVGAGGPSAPPNSSSRGTSGNSSIFSTITSAGGGGGGTRSQPGNPIEPGISGGSGGGAAGAAPAAGSGNTPPTSPPQGNSGGHPGTGGGGGACAAGGNVSGTTVGGAGVGTAISPANGTPGPSPSLRYFAGGGAAGGSNYPFAPSVPGGVGGGGPGGNNTAGVSVAGTNGTANTGGGGGAAGARQPGGVSSGISGSGGSGIVVIRYKFQ